METKHRDNLSDEPNRLSTGPVGFGFWVEPNTVRKSLDDLLQLQITRAGG